MRLLQRLGRPRDPVLSFRAMKYLTIACSLVLILALSLRAAPAAGSSSVEARLATQNTLFEEQFQHDLKSSPETATAYGDYRYNDRLDEASLAAIAADNAADRKFLAGIKAIPTTGFSPQDALSHEIFVRMLQQRIDDYGFKEFEMPLSQIAGPHLDLADLPLSVPFDTLKQYEDYIARLRQIPRVFTQTEEVLRAGMRDHLMPVRFLLEKVPEQCDGVVKANPFLLPLQQFPATISAADQERLSREMRRVVAAEVLPAYQAFGKFVATEYAPLGRTNLSIASLPGGEPRYMNEIRGYTTISTLSPDQIHQIGLNEIKRIENEMTVIARQQGFTGLAAYRDSLKTNPKYWPTSAQQILDVYRKYLAQMQLKLPELFGYLPGSPVTVEPIPEFQSAEGTHYQTGTPDGKRPGRISVATSDFANRSLTDDEAVAYHEGVPGHHMQLSVAQQMTGLPKFRQHVSNSGYIEGWALYAERLGKEVGFYQDPGSDYGRLRGEMLRAVRLVVDTGIHAKGWSREQVVEFMRQYSAGDEPLIQSETDRYISRPAQALAYTLGQLKFLELRERASKELGERFDIRAFHDEMLNGGVLPLDLLDARTNEWIREQKGTPDEIAFKSLYRELVEINTTRSVGSCTKAAEAMRAHLLAAGIAASDIDILAPADRPDDGALIAVLRGSDRAAKPILLLAHIDVVEANKSDWVRDPFRLTEEAGWYYGRGVSDDKSMAAIFTDNLMRYRQEGFRPRRDIKLALTCGEETPDIFNSVEWLIRTRPKVLEAAFALNEGAFGELDQNGRPVTLQIEAGEKVYQDYSLDVTDPGGHSARPTKSNPIVRLSGALARLGAHNFPVSLSPTTRAFFEAEASLASADIAADMRAVLKDPPDEAAAQRLWAISPTWNAMLRTTCVVTQISGGHARNALPQSAHANVNCRVLPGTPLADVRNDLVRVLADDSIQVAPSGNPGVLAPVPPLTPQIMGPVQRVAGKLWPGVVIVPAIWTGGTDGGFLNANGVPTYGLSGLFHDAEGPHHHGLNERIRVKSLLDGRRFLYEVVKLYANDTSSPKPAVH
jgi:uncharacterized protein (DUF885 family)/acetylornithine deacetylase/succinyl-diaminopimelate desuccinylase-like protein